MGREVRKVPADAEITYRYLTAAMKMRLTSSLAWRTVFFSNGESVIVGVFDSAEDAAHGAAKANRSGSMPIARYTEIRNANDNQ